MVALGWRSLWGATGGADVPNGGMSHLWCRRLCREARAGLGMQHEEDVGLLPLLPALCPFCPFSPQFPMAESSVWGRVPASPLVTLTTSCSIS